MLKPPDGTPEFVAGVDVSYITPNDAVAAYALIEVATGRLAWSATLRREVTFPYIPTYLTFRELPVLWDILHYAQEEKQLADVVLVDGAGLLHKRHAGIATHLGIVTGLSTIGVSKKRLCGQVDLEGLAVGDARPVIHEGQTVAIALQSQKRGQPIYVSPGQRVDIAFALRITQSLIRGHKLPEPTHWAHTFSRKAAKEMRS